MLTLILLVVLGGGVGLLAVSLAESSSKPATDAPESRRGEADPAADQPSPHPPSPPAAERPADPTPVPLDRTPTRPVPVEAPTPPVPAPGAHRAPGPLPGVATLPRRTHRGDVPASFTAVEGRYQDVARPPIWRRILSFVLILLITSGAGVAIAAVLGAVIGAASEILGNTIG